MEASANCISANLLQAQTHTKHFIIIDVRNPEEYHNKHIPSAINIPLPQLATEVLQFNKGNFYVTVCGKGGGRSAEAAELIRKQGYAAAWLCNGTFGWFK